MGLWTVIMIVVVAAMAVAYGVEKAVETFGRRDR